MIFYNALTMEKEEFHPIELGKVGIYACGPTVYDYIHVGNARPVILFDVLRRYLEYRGYEVNFVQNFTDVDDKIINRAKEEGISPKALAEKYIAEYRKDARALGVREATVHPRATEHISEIIGFIEILVEKGYAYQSGGDVYFRTKKYEDYGKLSHQPLEELQAGARIEVSGAKESPMDFTLWKEAKPGEPMWNSPWGAGRPGWHIECSAMAVKYLGKTLDIHCGGQDLGFPHHENELAQSEAANGCTFVNYWLHNGFISIDNKKMSKSKKNFFTVREAAEVYGYGTIRLFILMSHYRSPLNYSAEVLEQTKNAKERLENTLENLKFLEKNAVEASMSPAEAEKFAALSVYRERFIARMDDDFNTADGIAVIFELAREINSATAKNPSSALISACMGLFTELTDVLGIFVEDTESEDLEEAVEALIAARQAARQAKDFKKADEIRDQLKEMGVSLKDTPQGVKWRRLKTESV